MVVNNDETDEEADYLLIALAKTGLSRRVTRLDKCSLLSLLPFRAVLLRGLTSGKFPVLICWIQILSVQSSF